MMPQFDIFSFLSQLFWVFLSFLIFYLFICFYILPAIAAILKTRKRKLAAQVSSNINSELTANTNFSVVVKVILDNATAKLNSLLALDDNSDALNMDKNLTAVVLGSSTVTSFKTRIFSQAQISYLIYA